MVSGPGGDPLKVEDFSNYISKKSSEVDGALDGFLPRDGVPNLHEAVRYALGLDVDDRAKRGKRLRPVLCLLVAETFGAPPGRALPFAMACELLHNFLLIHDDIQDGDVKRRGRDTVWVRYGRDHAINVGDYMFTLAYRAIFLSRGAGAGDGTIARLADLMTTTMEHTGIGQALDMNDRRRRDLTLDDYLRTVEEKTGYYLACALTGGAVMVSAAPGVLDAVERFGRLAMPIFQIADDLLDLSEAKGRGEVGSDIKEGKRSFLVVHTAAHCTPQEAQQLYDILDKPREDTTSKDVAWAIALFRKYGAEDAGHRLEEELLSKAMKVLAEVPPDLRHNLGLAARFLIDRKA